MVWERERENALLEEEEEKRKEEEDEHVRGVHPSGLVYAYLRWG